MIVLAAGVAVLSTIAVASETDHRSAYAGQETRPIKSLSAENQRLTQFQAMYKAAEEQISDMRAKLESMSRTPVEKEPTISPEGPSSSTMKH